MLLHNDALEAAVGRRLLPADFYRDAHRRIYTAMLELSEDDCAIDLTTLTDLLGRHGDIDEVGGPAYISALVDGMPRSSNIEHYADIIREKRRLRDVIYFSNKLASAAYLQEDQSSTLLADADSALLRLAVEEQGDEFATQADVVREFLERLKHRVEHRGELLGLSTGFPTLDEMTCGMVPGEMTVLAGTPSTGKTAMALQIALAGARAGQTTKAAVVMLSLEMQRIELAAREGAHLGNVELFKIRNGWFYGDRDLSRLRDAMTATMLWPIFTCDIATVGMSELRSLCRRLRVQQPISLIVVDYIQLMEGDDIDENRTMALGQIARQLKQLGRQVGAAVLVLAQLSRDHQKKNRKPDLHDIRESGAIEQHTDNVWMLWHDPDEEKKSDPMTELLIRKQRNGPLYTVKFTFDKPTQTFVDIANIDKIAKEPAQTDFPAFSS